MVCKNWGCGELYEHSDDIHGSKGACKHHPGSYQMGSIHGLWPESWTCCRGAWSDLGCSYGRHKGVPEKKLHYLCINRGEINPDSGKPDSSCGREFYVHPPEGVEEKPCSFHSGYLKRHKKGSDEGAVWSCC